MLRRRKVANKCRGNIHRSNHCRPPISTKINAPPCLSSAGIDSWRRQRTDLAVVRKGAGWANATYSVLIDQIARVFVLALVVIACLPWTFSLTYGWRAVWIMSGLLLRSFDETRGAQACADNDVAPRAYGEEFSYVTDKKTSKFLHPGVGCSVPLFMKDLLFREPDPLHLSVLPIGSGPDKLPLEENVSGRSLDHDSVIISLWCSIESKPK